MSAPPEEEEDNLQFWRGLFVNICKKIRKKNEKANRCEVTSWSLHFEFLNVFKFKI